MTNMPPCIASALCQLYSKDFSCKLTFDSKIQSTQDASSIVLSYVKIASSKASEFCSQSVIGTCPITTETRLIRAMILSYREDNHS